MKAAKKGAVKKIVFFVLAALCVAVLVAVTTVVGILDQSFADIFGGTELDSATRTAGEALALQIEEEGIVLVKNDKNTLPIKQDEITYDGELRVNVFGWAAIDWIMGGSGSGRAVNNTDGNSFKPATDLLKALAGYDVLSADGIKYNPDLISLYTDFKNGRDSASTNTLNTHDYESCVLWEPQMSAYSDTLKENAEKYSDVALVVLGRISGESNDAPKVQYKYNAKNSSKVTDRTRTYLDISAEEDALLQYVGANYDKVIVIINSTNTMNLEFMDRIAGLDACIIAGGTGNNGASAIPNILFGKKRVKVQAKDENGEYKFDENGDAVYETDENGNVKTEIINISPSGKTVDTYAYDFKSNPNYAYAGMDGVTQYTGTANSLYPLTTTNPNVGSSDKNYPGVSYLDYAEGIYVGYKWYETADAEGYFDSASLNDKTGYDAVVQYPFGYGLTYTTFDWSVGTWTVANDKISVPVTVTNTGNYPAQEVVEMYYTPFYDKTHGIEKAAVNLCAFEKTQVAVEPGKSQTLTLSFDIQDMASYVESEVDGAYVLEAGNYTVSLRTDSHNVKSVSGGNASYTYNTDKKVYDNYLGTNGVNEIKNLFTGNDVTDGIAVDGSDTETDIQKVWLSRSDFSATFKTQKAAARAWNSKLVKNNLYTSAQATAWDNAWLSAYQEEYGDSPVFKQGQERVYMLTDGDGNFTEDAYFFGNPDNFDGDEWETLLNQLTETEMRNLVCHGYIHEEALASIGKPRTQSLDGPSQIGSFNVNVAGTGYPMPTVLAQSFNETLAKTYGLSVAEETLKSGRDGWYAPGVNLHRSAFGGRNYEYYSEDSFLSGIMCAATVRGALDAGVYTYIKHFIGYDQESYRDGLYCWMTEQTLREIYLSPYKRAIDAGATGIMTSYGRLGSIWSGGSQSLLTDLLRDEWGFKGTVITDYSDHQEFMIGDQMLRAGGDLWMDGYGDTGKWTMSTSSHAFKYQLRQASKHIIYMWTNAAFEHKQYAEASGNDVQARTSSDVFRWWWLAVAAIDVLCAAGAAVLVIFAIKKPKNLTATENTDSTETVEMTE